jgi:hypothetical protein
MPASTCRNKVNAWRIEFITTAMETDRAYAVKAYSGRFFRVARHTRAADIVEQSAAKVSGSGATVGFGGHRREQPSYV